MREGRREKERREREREGVVRRRGRKGETEETEHAYKFSTNQ